MMNYSVLAITFFLSVLAYLSTAYGQSTVTQKPFDLVIDFSLPETGMPPVKVDLGNVMDYVAPNVNKQQVTVVLQNPNPPGKPIPLSVFNAALPHGALVPIDVLKPCVQLTIEVCEKQCHNAMSVCQDTCDSSHDCITFCKSTLKGCSKFCNASIESDSSSSTNFEKYRFKCERACKGNSECVARCNSVCKPPTAPSTMPTKPPSPRPTLPVYNYSTPVPATYPPPEYPTTTTAAYATTTPRRMVVPVNNYPTPLPLIQTTAQASEYPTATTPAYISTMPKGATPPYQMYAATVNNYPTQPTPAYTDTYNANPPYNPVPFKVPQIPPMPAKLYGAPYNPALSGLIDMVSNVAGNAVLPDPVPLSAPQSAQ